MKRFFCLILSLALIFSLSMNCFATEALSVSDSDLIIDEFENQKLITAHTDAINLAILIDTDTNYTDVSLSTYNAPNTVYQIYIDDYTLIFTGNSTADFVNAAINFIINNKQDANVINFTSEESSLEAPNSPAIIMSSAGADLMPTLISELGSDEYADLIKSSQVYNGLNMKLYEALDIQILDNGTKSWASTISVSSLIVGVLGLVSTSTLIGAICGAYGVYASAYSLLPPGKIRTYNCIGSITRYVKINGSSYVYNFAHKKINYKGYENASLTNTERAYLDTGSRSVTYPPYGQSATYFNSFTSQISDAYDMYLRLGQMP